jgi:tetratricopeptide (TPR) repeat protein
LKLKKYKEALNDFEKAIKINPDKQIAYIGKGDCLRLS